MNHIRWAAWGVVDIEALERMQRRNYIKRARAELFEKNIMLECGGSTHTPWYSVMLPLADDKPIRKQSYGGLDAFKKVCEWTLHTMGDVQQLEKERMDNERSEDGGVRRAGAEA